MTPEREYLLVRERLAEEGIHSRDIYGLLKTPYILPRLAPLLLRLFDEVSSLSVKTDLVRVLSHAGISPQRFVDELKLLRPAIEAGDRQAASLAWTIGEALDSVADASVYRDLVELLRNRRLGETRQMLPYALARIKQRRAERFAFFSKSSTTIR